jgi:cold shock CspA family protein
MTTGTVEWFDHVRGHGIICTDDGECAFVACCDVDEHYPFLDHGERVEFLLAPALGQHKAICVHRLRPPAGTYVADASRPARH